MKRLISLILIFLGLFSLAGCKNTTDAALFLYISGSNLESDSKGASRMINELTSSNQRVYGLIGGSESYHNDLIKDTSLFKIENKQLSILKRSEANLGDAKTLAEFISFTKTIEAERRALLFWGHGSPTGILKDSIYDDSLDFNELKQGLAGSYFDLILFNCCYGANLDLLTSVSANAKYAIAAEGSFSTAGFAYSSIIKNLEAKDLLLAAKAIIDETNLKHNDPYLVLSLIDLELLNKNISSIDDFFYYLIYDYKAWFKALGETNGLNYFSKDLIDISEHYLNMADGAKELFQSLVLYEIHGNSYDTNGIYIYYKKDFSANDYLKYKNSSQYPSYLRLLKEKTNLDNDVTVTFNSLASNDLYSYRVGINSLDLVDTITYLAYDQNNNLLLEDLLGLNIIEDANNKISLNLANNIYGTSLKGYILPSELLSTADLNGINRYTYRGKAKLNEIEGYLYYAYSFMDDYNNGSYELMGFKPKDYVNSNTTLIKLKKDDLISIGSHKFKYNNEALERISLKDIRLAFRAYDIYGKSYDSIKK